MTYYVCPLQGPAPAVNPITVVDEGSMNSTLLISWSQSNCAVQYVVTIINSSDDRVYPNITTSNTNTTVTLPTGVEFCVTLVAVDSIDRRGPDTTPVCYGECYMLVYSCILEFELCCFIQLLEMMSISPLQFLLDIQVYVSLYMFLKYMLGITTTPTVIASPTVTHSPVMVGGVNVAAAVAIPVVLVLLVVCVVVVGTVTVYVPVFMKRTKGLLLIYIVCGV